MSVAAFVLIAVMLAAYILLDGYDLGIAAITPLVARTAREREASMRAIGPFWNGNEVWLIAAGGTLFALFPRAYASAFSGFYLPFIVVLWLLMFRGIAMELRGHFPSPIWRDFWDFCFTASSVLLILLFGIALGNLLRGVPLDRTGYFVGTFAFLLNPFALLVGALAVAALGAHGALFLATRVEGAPAQRAVRLLTWLVPLVLALYVAGTIATFAILGAAALRPWWVLVPALAVAASIVEIVASRRAHARTAFTASSVFLAVLLAGAAIAMYPYLLPGFPLRASGLSLVAASPSPAALTVAFGVVLGGLCAVGAYAAFVWRKLSGKVRV